MSRLSALAGVMLSACVTESLSICINCGGISINEVRGGFAIVLTANTGVALPCENLRVQMEATITWDGCLSPRGGALPNKST